MNPSETGSTQSKSTREPAAAPFASAVGDDPYPRAARRPSVAVFKFCSCDGCQLQLIDVAHDYAALRGLLDGVEIKYFSEAKTDGEEAGPFDVALIEGSISTERDRARIQNIRLRTHYLITIGACATSGGVQALRNWADHEEFVSAVYAKPEFISSLKGSTPIADHVFVDFELRGCPVNKNQLAQVIAAFIVGKRPSVPTHSVCIECKRRGNVCVTVARGEPCLGPVTQAGCGALCPAFDRGCYGCFGSMEQPNMDAQTALMRAEGLNDRQIGEAFRAISHSVAFDNAAEKLLWDNSSKTANNAGPEGHKVLDGKRV